MYLPTRASGMIKHLIGTAPQLLRTSGQALKVEPFHFDTFIEKKKQKMDWGYKLVSLTPGSLFGVR